MQNNNLYWNNFYKTFNIKIPSLFAMFCNLYVQPQSEIVELGCGQGRDSLFFSRMGHNITAVDQSDIIDELIIRYPNVKFIKTDAINFTYENTSAVYCRWFLHAVNKQSESFILKNAFNGLNKNGRIMIECRSIHDSLYGIGEEIGEHEFMTTHYRRFIDRSELEKSLIDIGFSLILSMEGYGWSKMGEDDPHLIRIIAEKL